MAYKTTPKSKKTIEALWRLEKIILDSLEYDKVVQEIVDSVLLELGYLKLGYEIVVLSLIDEYNKNLERISISETKKARQALAETPVPFKKIIIPLKDKDNALIKAINKVKPQVVKDWKYILCPAFTEDEAHQIQKSLDIQTSLVYPVLLKGKAIGTLIFSMSKPAKKVSEDERDLIKSFSDIVGLAVQNATLYSKLNKTTKELRTANRNLRHLDKLKDEFVFIATHELKNPVTAMRGYLSLIQEGNFGKVPEKLKHPLEQLDVSNQQLITLVNDLLEIARSEAKNVTIKTEPVDLCDSVDAVIAGLKPIADNKKLKLQHTCPKEHFSVKADPNKLKEIFNNLISNAIKYTEQGTIEVTHFVENDMVVTHVKDSGLGMSEKAQKKIFSRFYRAEEHAAKGIPGTGLGLFIVKQIVEKMNGKIWFKSKLGEGTTFSFTLPTA